MTTRIPPRTRFTRSIAAKFAKGRSRRPSGHGCRIEPLESRIAPATVTSAAPNVTIDLNQTNELATFHTDGTGVVVVFTSNGVFHGSSSFSSSTFNGTFTITDSAAGTAVAFADSTGSYPQAFSITLDDAASGNVTFAGDSTFSASFTATTSAGNISSDASSTLTLTGSGSNLSLSAIAPSGTGPDVVLKGALSVAGTTGLTGNLIVADNAANDFVGALSLQSSAPGAGSIFDSNDLVLSSVGVAFAGNGTMAITAAGNITQASGTAIGGDGPGTLAISSLGGSITLPNGSNSFSPGISPTLSLALSVVGTNTVTVKSSTRVILGDVRMGTGALSVPAEFGMTQAPGTTIESDGNVTLGVGLLVGGIDVSNSGNRIAGTVTFTGGSFLSSVKLRNAHPAALPPVVSGSGDTDVTIFFDNTGIALPGYSLNGATGGDLAVTAGGDITQTARLAIGGTSTFTVLGDSAITLTHPTNAFVGSVGFNAPQSTQPITIVESNGLVLGTSKLGRGPFSATASAGNITQSGSGFVQEKGASPATLTVTAGTSISLTNNVNRFTGDVIFAGPNLTSVNVHNADFMADFADLTIPATVTSLNLTFENASIALPSLTRATLTVNAQGIVQQAGTSLIVSGQATFNANAFPLVLGNAGNDFTTVTLNNSGRNDVVLEDVNGVTFAGTSNLGSGRLTVLAGGNIAETGTVNQAAAGADGDVSFSSIGGTVILGGSNSFRGPVSVTVAGANGAAITSNALLTLGDVTTGAGSFSATAGSLGIAQDPNSVLNFGGTSSFTTTIGGPITLTNRTNTFAGAVSAVTTSDLAFRTAGAVVLNSINVGGTLSIQSGGAITQTGSIVGGSDATFDVGGANVTLTNASNDFSSVSATGASISIRDTDDLDVDTIHFNGGTLTLTTGGDLGLVGATSGIVQTGAGVITLDIPASGNVALLSANNVLRGSVSVLHSTDVALQSQGDLTFAGASTITGFLNVVSGGVLTLPTNLTGLTALTASAVTTTISSDITVAGGAISFTGNVQFTGSRTLSGASSITFSGDVTAGGPLTMNLSNAVTLAKGTWNQGANNLNITGGSPALKIGDDVAGAARFIMTAGTISVPSEGSVEIERDGTFQVGENDAAAETVTIANGAGTFRINGNLSVGFGATTNDKLVKTGSGSIAIITTFLPHLLGSGLAGASASPVLVAQTAALSGNFANTLDADGAPRDFFAGSDIVTPAYDFHQLTVKSGGVVSATGTATGFLPDGDQFTVTSSLGASAGLTTVQDVSGMLGIVVRNTAAAGASTLKISTTGGGDGQLSVSGIAVHAPGAVAINAPAANFVQSVTTDGTLTSFTARDLIGATTRAPFVLEGGGAASATTSITARNVQQATIELACVLGSFKAVSVTNDVDITAQKFGTITTTGALAGTSSSPGAANPGHFGANLTSTTMVNGTVLAAAKIAGTIEGVWDLRGSVGTVTAALSSGWTLGTLAAANLHNGGLLTDVKTVAVGVLDEININATGAVGTITTSAIVSSRLTAGSFGTIKLTGNPALGLAGAVTFSSITATGNVGGIALKSLSIAGSLDSCELTFLDGNVGALTVGRRISNTDIIAVDKNGHGSLKSITVGDLFSSTVDARTIGSFKVIGNLAAGLFGDVDVSAVIVHGNNKGVGLRTFEAKGSVTESGFTIESGNITSFKVARTLGDSGIRLFDPAFGNLGTIQAGVWTANDVVLAKTIGTLASVGVPAGPAGPQLLGGIDVATITAYLDTGTTAAIAKLTAKGDVSSSTVNAEHGIGSVTIGRTLADASSIVADDALAGAASVGRIAKLTVGACASSTIAANTLGKVRFTGYPTPEDNGTSFVPGDVVGSTIVAHGAAPGKPVGIDTFSVGRNFESNSAVIAPFGIKTLTVGGRIGSTSTTTKIVTDNPVDPTSGFIDTLTAGDILSSTVRAGRIGVVKTSGNVAAGLFGNITSSTIAINSASIGAQALGTLTVAGDFSQSVLDAPATVGTINVLGRITSSTSTQTRIQAGYETGGHLGTLAAAALGAPDSSLTSLTLTTDLVSQNLGTLTLKGNASRGISGTTDRAFIDILGNVAGVGLGTFFANGTASNSLFRVNDGDITSFTAERLVASDVLVGFRFVKASDITLSPTATQWAATNHKLGVFKTTAAFDASDPDSASFVDSNIIAALLGKITLSGVNPDADNSAAFGVAFRASAGVAAKGVVQIDGSAVPLPPPASSGQFNYLGLAG